MIRSVLPGFTHRVRSAVSGQSNNHKPFVAAEPGDNAAALGGKMAEHGHVFFSGTLPPEPVLEARGEALALLREAGWVAPAGPHEARGPA